MLTCSVLSSADAVPLHDKCYHIILHILISIPKFECMSVCQHSAKCTLLIKRESFNSPALLSGWAKGSLISLFCNNNRAQCCTTIYLWSGQGFYRAFSFAPYIANQLYNIGALLLLLLLLCSWVVSFMGNATCGGGGYFAISHCQPARPTDRPTPAWHT